MENRNVIALEAFEAVAHRTDRCDDVPATPDLTVIADDEATAEHATATQELLTVAEAAERFVVTESKLRRQLAAGALDGAAKAHGPRGSHWVVPAASLAAAGYAERDGWVPDRLATVDGSVLSALVDSVGELTAAVERGRDGRGDDVAELATARAQAASLAERLEHAERQVQIEVEGRRADAAAAVAERLELTALLGRQQADLEAAYGELAAARIELTEASARIESLASRLDGSERVAAAELQAERARSSLIADELARSRAEVEHLRSQAELDRLRIDDLRMGEETSPRRRFGRPA